MSEVKLLNLKLVVVMQQYLCFFMQLSFFLIYVIKICCGPNALGLIANAMMKHSMLGEPSKFKRATLRIYLLMARMSKPKIVKGCLRPDWLTESALTEFLPNKVKS